MRLLFITETYPSGLSGSSAKTRSALEYILQRGHITDVACIDFETLKKQEFIHPRLKIYCVHKRGTRTLRLGLALRLMQFLFSLKPVIATRIFDSRLQTIVDTLRHSQNYDYIFFEGFSSLQYIHRMDARHVYIDHADITDLMWQRCKQNTNWLNKIFFLSEYIRSGWYEKKYMSRVNEIWSINKNSQKRFRGEFPIKNIIMPTIIPLGKNVYNSSSKHIVFSGTLSWHENIVGLTWFLTHCWGLVLNKFPDTKLYITGQLITPSMAATLRRYPNVYYLGFVDNLEEVYKHAAVAISPLETNEGIKIKILTYMKYGIPVVAMKSNIESIHYTGAVLTASAKTFATTLIRALSNKKLRSRLSRVARKNVSKYHGYTSLNRFFKMSAKIEI